MTEALSLEAYQQAEIEVLEEDAKRQFRVHVTLFIGVNLVATLFNLLVADEVLWFFYPLVGWGLGLAFHYLAGVRSLRSKVAERQTRIEERALRGQASPG
ncbi:MAG: 2TM domain-containing protein [Actinomycetota bacterium]|nr:2TM domain-containing protein [Actinomycetota bacterium]